MVEHSIQALQGADGHSGKVEPRYWLDGDRGDHWSLLPVKVGFTDEITSTKETQAKNDAPGCLPQFSLKQANEIPLKVFKIPRMNPKQKKTEKK